MTDSPASRPTPALSADLRRLYVIRFAFALLWGVTLLTVPLEGVALPVLLAIYPLVDAGAVLWQLRSEGPGASPRAAEWVNVVTSVLAAVGLAIASSFSPAAALATWGAWAIVSGVTQLVTALQRRRTGGQVPLVVSGALSVLAGSGFAVSGLLGAGTVGGVGGYAIVGGIFFLIAAIQLSVRLRRGA